MQSYDATPKIVTTTGTSFTVYYSERTPDGDILQCARTFLSKCDATEFVAALRRSKPKVQQPTNPDIEWPR
jgi:hypothetical protein